MDKHPYNQQKHAFTGKMNLDDGPISLTTDWSQDYGYALNIRNGYTTDGNDGTVENVRGTAPVTNADLNVFLSERLSESRACSTGFHGSPVTYVMKEGSYVSAIDQSTANALAQAYFDAHKEAYFTANLVCNSDEIPDPVVIYVFKELRGYSATYPDTNGGIDSTAEVWFVFKDVFGSVLSVTGLVVNYRQYGSDASHSFDDNLSTSPITGTEFNVGNQTQNSSYNDSGDLLYNYTNTIDLRAGTGYVLG